MKAFRFAHIILNNNIFPKFGIGIGECTENVFASFFFTVFITLNKLMAIFIVGTGGL